MDNADKKKRILSISIAAAALVLIGMTVMFAALKLADVRILVLCIAALLTVSVLIVWKLIVSVYRQKNTETRENVSFRERREHLLIRMLVDGNHAKDGYQDVLRQYEIIMDQPYYCVAVLPDIDKIPGDSIREQAEEVGGLALRVMPDTKLYSVAHNDTIVIILCTDQGGAEGFKAVRDGLESLAEQLKAQYGTAFSIFLGCEVYSPRDIPTSYRSALAAYGHSLEQDEETAAVTLNANTFSGKSNLLFLDDLHLMLGYLINAEFKAASQVLARVFEQNIHEHQPYRTLVSVRLEFFRETFTQAIEATIAGNEAAIEDYLQNRRILDSADESMPIEVIHQVYFRFAEIAENVTAQRRQEIIGPAKQTRAFIDDHISDSMLDITMLSDKLGFSASYLSRLFKSAYGQTILNYITSKRIAMAEDFLRNTNLTVEQIASRVGYNSVSTFSRAFQKIYGASPNQYRRNCKKQ